MQHRRPGRVAGEGGDFGKSGIAGHESALCSGFSAFCDNHHIAESRKTLR
jgi:hypothetical protein